ncbi:molybdopterin dinucleotide binding domain-containing protein, partial [Mycolicibacterium arseniciresistens]
PQARAQTAAAWNISALPAATGRDTAAILDAAGSGDVGAVLVGGLDIADLPDPDAAMAALRAAPFVVSLELRESAVTAIADVVFPVAPVVEKSGSFVNWEGRQRPFPAALQTNANADRRVLHILADEMGVDLGLPTPEAAAAEMAELGLWAGARPAGPDEAAPASPAPEAGQAVLASWRMLLDAGRLQDGEPHLAGTARPAVVRMSAGTAAEIGCAEGDPVRVGTERGDVVLPLAVTDMDDRVVWLPTNSPGAALHQRLGAGAGAVVTIGRAT